VSADGETFFRVDSGRPHSREAVREGGRALRALDHRQGVKLSCRIDDKDGWPLVRVPTGCAQRYLLLPGQYLWTQLPLTVESMRRTQLKRVLPPVVLSGNKPHPIDFFTWYQAKLGTDGKDEFTFDLAGETEVTVAMDKRHAGPAVVSDARANRSRSR